MAQVCLNCGMFLAQNTDAMVLWAMQESALSMEGPTGWRLLGASGTLSVLGLAVTGLCVELLRRAWRLRTP